MGSSYTSDWTPEQRRDAAERYRLRLAAEAAELQGARQQLAKKIVDVAVDKIIEHIIRPGPDAEERECYDMADEMRRFREDLYDQVTAQLNVNGGCK